MAVMENAQSGAEGGAALVGSLTEETDLSFLLEGNANPVVVDLGNVSRVNSCGVREWLEFIRNLEGQGRHVVLKRCAPSVVLQINLIYDFVGSEGTVESIFAPYLCPACGSESCHLISLDGFGNPDELLGERPCPQCRVLSSFADVPELYLSFISHQ